MKTETLEEPKDNAGRRWLHRDGRCESVESETCPHCAGKCYVPMWDGEGSEIGEETCYRCLGTGRVERIAPTTLIT
jgi:DnaJ-class molecular chaperone